MKKYYMVLNTQTHYTRCQHENYNVAKAEAIRLSSIHPGQEFVVLCAIARVKKVDVQVDELPFAGQIPF